MGGDFIQYMPPCKMAVGFVFIRIIQKIEYLPLPVLCLLISSKRMNNHHCILLASCD